MKKKLEINNNRIVKEVTSMFIRNEKTLVPPVQIVECNQYSSCIKSMRCSNPAFTDLKLTANAEQEIFNQCTRNSHKNINKTHIKITDKR